jgi:hypothetical protein
LCSKNGYAGDPTSPSSTRTTGSGLAGRASIKKVLDTNGRNLGGEREASGRYLGGEYVDENELDRPKNELLFLQSRQGWVQDPHPFLSLPSGLLDDEHHAA